MTVYVICEPAPRRDGVPAYDVSPAAMYGPIEFVFRHGFMSPSRDPEKAIIHAREVLSRFDDAVDYVVWAGGDPLAAILVGSELAKVAAYRYLRWEKSPTGTGGNYVPVTIDR
jgi:hypothetical protein